jgi:hypothetical protein
MVKRVTPQDEARMLDAIERSAALVNDGLHPNDALAKAAGEHGIPSGHLDVMVHAYNTGRTNRQRRDGDTIFEKAADFDLADTDVVRGILFPPKVKTAAEKVFSTSVSEDYQLPPTTVLREKAAAATQAVLKEAVLPALTDKKPAAYPRDERQLMKRAYTQAQRLQRDTENCRRLASSAFDKLAETFQELTDYFHRLDSQPLPAVREHVNILFGNRGTLVLDEIIAVTPGLTKMARHKTAGTDLRLVDEVAALVSQCLDEVDAYKRCKQAYDELAERNDAEVEKVLRPFSGGSQSVMDEYAQAPWTFEKTGASPLFGGFVGGFGGGVARDMVEHIGKSIQPPTQNAAVQKTLDSLTDPNHEAYLRSIRTNAALQDLMLNDPVISSHGPDDVTQAFNDIVELSPRVADQHMLLQTLLRNRLTKGQLDPFEVDQLLGMEQKLQKRDSPRPVRSVLDDAA